MKSFLRQTTSQFCIIASSSLVYESLGAVHKRRPQSGEGVYPVRTFFRQGGRGLLQMRTSTLFRTKNSDFLKFLVCPHGQGGRRGSIFRDGRLLWTACFCLTTPTQNGSVCMSLSGWATTTGRLLGLKDSTTRYHIGSRIKVSKPFGIVVGAFSAKT